MLLPTINTTSVYLETSQYPTHKISDLFYPLTDKIDHPQLEAKDGAKEKLSLGTLYPMVFKSEKLKKSLSLHALTWLEDSYCVRNSYCVIVKHPTRLFQCAVPAFIY